MSPAEQRQDSSQRRSVITELTKGRSVWSTQYLQ